MFRTVAAVLSCFFASAAHAACDTGTLDEKVACLTAYVDKLQAVLDVNANGDVVFTGANVYVQNGKNSTLTSNGKGNLILGYAESNGTERRTGSHDLVVGAYNDWKSSGGLVAGFHDTISAPYATVTGGRHNNASGFASTVAGGRHHVLTAPLQTALGPMTTDDDLDTVTFDGANVYVRSGSGATDGALNGLGNLIIGYGEDNGDVRSGSHNLVVGSLNDWQSYGGVVFGYDNELGTFPYSTITGGEQNQTNGAASVVCGGIANLTSGEAAVVAGGTQNTASGIASLVAGGEDNAASGVAAAAVGGQSATASGAEQTLSGGTDTADLATTAYVGTAVADVVPNLADYLSVDTATDSIYFDGANVYVRSGSGFTDGTVNGLGNLIVGYGEDGGLGLDRGGSHNLVVGTRHSYPSYGSVVFGYENFVLGPYTAVLGGDQNMADSQGVIVGGELNATGPNTNAVVVGGFENAATGAQSVVSGGYSNVAAGSLAVVSGGSVNSAIGATSVVSGGELNHAEGNASVVTGGANHTAAADDSIAP